jgi:ribose transport system ATP-binding protein
MSSSVVTPLLEMRGISKRFAGLAALENVDFIVQAGEIHALIGQNGAGKSTLMKILAGVFPVEQGEIVIDGQSVQFSIPRDALAVGIGIVYQDLSLVPKLSAADNIFLGREPGGVVIDEALILENTTKLLKDLGVKDINPRTIVETLPLAQQQLIEIARVLAYKPRILVLDEPTSALAEEETSLLLGILRGLRKQGIAIIYISHRFREILDICDRATVLRNGQLVTVVDTAGISELELIELTLGEKLDAFSQGGGDSADAAETILEVQSLHIGRAVQDASFALKQGEIVGMTGLLGAGQNEVARALFGIMPEVSGIIKRRGQPVFISSPRSAIQHGIGLLTEQRKVEGLVLEMTVQENITLPSLRRFLQGALLLLRRNEARAARQMINALRVKTPSSQVKVGTLSGGNQQKVILSKWLLRDLDILIFISPTQGIDVGAKAEIYQQLRELARQGKTILVVSEDHLEILNIAHRILVMYHGKLAHVFPNNDVNETELLAAIQGFSA